jgi:HSP20 family protein
MYVTGFPISNRLDEMRREMDRVLDNFGMGSARGPRTRPTTFPAMNVWDAGDTVCVEAEIPGVGKDDLEIFAVGNELTVKGRRPALEGALTYHRQERGAGEFTRVLTLPVEVDAEKVDAVLDHGVLTVRLPKAEAAKRKRITVKAG